MLLNQKKIITVLNGIIINLDVKQEQLEFDGGAYSGELNSSKGTAEGYGVLRLNDGSVYSGNFKDSKFHGYGSYILASGSLPTGLTLNTQSGFITGYIPLFSATETDFTFGIKVLTSLS